MLRDTLTQSGRNGIRRLRRFLRLLWLLRPASERSTTPAEQAAHLSQRAKKLLTAHGVRVHLTGNLPESPSILVANHLGYLDPLAVISKTPCAVVAKAELSNWVLIGRHIQRLGILFVHRDSPASGATTLRKAHRILRAKTSALIFPEGVTTDGYRVSAFQRGAFGLSMKTNVPVVPISITFSDPAGAWIDADSTFLHHYYQQAAKRETSVHLHYHEPTYALPAETAEEFAERVRASVESVFLKGGSGL